MHALWIVLLFTGMIGMIASLGLVIAAIRARVRTRAALWLIAAGLALFIGSSLLTKSADRHVYPASRVAIVAVFVLPAARD